MWGIVVLPDCTSTYGKYKMIPKWPYSGSFWS